MPAIKPTHYKKLSKTFENLGWKYDRTKGDHLVFVKKGYLRPVIIPAYKSVPVLLSKIISELHKLPMTNTWKY